MKKGKFGGFFGMTFLFAFVVFCALGAALLISLGVTYFLVLQHIVDLPMELEPQLGRMFLVLAVVSFPVGLLVAGVASKIPLKPVHNLIASMERLASGDFSTRVSAGPVMRNYPAFVQLSESFNKMARELENTELLRSDFINNLSHEFKTPIVSISGFAQLLRREDLSPEQRREYLDIIIEESQRLSHIATNVLNLTRIENQSILTDVAEFNLSEQIRGSVLLLAEKWEEKGLALELEFDEYTILGSEELLKQVWINLLDNAIKFSPHGGTLGVRITSGEGAATVCVTNTGPEIPPQSRDRIFQKFYQADESHATEGSGIGLAIVRQVVQLHGGSVTVQCEGGTTAFTVTLPAVCRA